MIQDRRFHKVFYPVAIAVVTFALSACGSSYRPDSPDVRYRTAEDYETLQLPPDITGSRDQLFAIPPGKGKISRSSIVPEADSIKFRRDGQLAWLEIALPVETLWPELVSFIEFDGATLAMNNSLTGMLITDWRQPQTVEPRKGLLHKILGNRTKTDEDRLERYILRLERGQANASRLFARYNAFSNKQDNPDTLSEENVWQYQDADPARSADLLTRILIWIGIEEQKSKQILSNEDASAIRHDIQLETTADAKSYLLIWDDYESAFKKVKNSVNSIGLSLSDNDIDKGIIEVFGDIDYLAEIKTEQQRKREENRGFFSGLKSLISPSGNDAVELEFKLLRVEPRVYAVIVQEPDAEIVTGEPARLILESVKNAIIGSLLAGIFNKA